MTQAPTQCTDGGRRLASLTVEKYEAMVATGLLAKRDRLELIEGHLVEKPTKHPPHSVTVGLCFDVISASFPTGWHVRAEQPVRIPDRDSEPEPDLAVARGRRADYLRVHPGPGDVALVIEIADSSIEDDRQMALTYGGSGIPTYWLVNIRDRQLEVYTNPSGPADPLGYRHVQVLFPDNEVPLILDGQFVVRIPVAEFLPPSVDDAAPGH
jgi:Uma2 family endonuclease